MSRRPSWKILGVLLLPVALLLPRPAAAWAPPLQHGELGQCALDSGAFVEGCQVGYRIYGDASAPAARTVVLPSWYSGTSADWGAFFGAHRLLDPAAYRYIVIDALGGGVSSSPSVSAAQAGQRFPSLTVGDMVRAEHRLLTEVLGLTHVHAVLGVSMGGMQALRWAVDYPDFMDRVVAIAGTPRTLPEDVKDWQATLVRLGVGDVIVPLFGADLATVWGLPQAELESLPGAGKISTDDRLWQMRAMAVHDVAPTDPDFTALAPRLRARLLVVVNSRDTLLRPQPSLALAAAVGAEVQVQSGRCGHLGPMVCEIRRTREAVQRFLAAP